MFNHLIVLILLLLFVSFGGEVKRSSWMLAPLPAFLTGLAIYCGLLFLIRQQSKWFKKETGVFLVNCQCLLFFGLFFYLFGSHRFLGLESLNIGFSLLLYAAGLALFYLRFGEAENQIRLLIPMALPFLFLSLLSDFFGKDLNAILLLVFFVGMMILLPVLLVTVWKCDSMPPSELKDRLTALCQKAAFSHRGLKIWNTMEKMMTAAIIGIIPQLRYILFTAPLLQRLSPQAVEAVLAHEIGHSKRHHLLFYPLILLGMMMVLTLFALFAAPFLTAWLENETLIPLFLFLCFGFIVWIYFRTVFGFFSRLFERQADLHVFALGVPPEAMIEALDKVGIGSGFSHLTPNWHHHSIQERIDFLSQAINQPSLIAQHHKKVRRALIIYCAILAVAILSVVYEYQRAL